ncbi:MAG TPA: cell division protein FtsB [Acidiferrobacterales bacterium]|nr:cell division protein FtsB [Acidiferrobacterales bacterium]
MKIASYVLLVLLLLLQYPLWFGNSSVITLWRLEREIAAQKAENARLREHNAALEAEVLDLKNGLTAIEERARSELGMVKKGETFFQTTDAQTEKPKSKK